MGVFTILALLKIAITLAAIVILLNRKTKMAISMFAGSAVLFLLTGPSPYKLLSAITATAASASTWEIIIALYFVMCLEYQLRTSGIINGVMAASRRIFRSDRVLLVMMPSFLGFLPSLGGAIFSAPLVENAGKSYNLSPEAKTTINYWFRHVWEFTNPMFTGMLLASQISSIPLSTLVSNMLWVTVLSILIGWVFLIAPLKQLDHLDTDRPADTHLDRPYIALAAGPILANLFLIVALKMAASLSMALVVAAMLLILRQNTADIRSMLSHALDKNLFLGVAGILFFQHMLRQSGIIVDIAAFLDQMAITPAVVVGIIAFTGGLLTGTSQGFVAMAFPFIGILAPGDLTLTLICFVMGTAGHMLSPAHLCLIVTLDYFKSDFAKTLRPVFMLEILMVVATVGFIKVWG